MSELFQQYQNYILFAVAFAVLAVLSKLETVRSAIITLWGMVQTVISFIGDAFREGTTGKTSYARVAGSFVIYKITSITEKIPSEWMTMFMFLVGYQLLSEILKNNPTIAEFIKAKYGINSSEKKDNEPPTV